MSELLKPPLDDSSLRNRVPGASDKISSPFPRERTVSSSPCPSQHDSFILVSVLFLDTGVLNLTLHLRRPPSVYFHPFHTVDEARKRGKRNSERESSRRRVCGARQRVDRETARARAKQGKWKSYYSRSGRGGRIWLVMGLILSREIQKTLVPYPHNVPRYLRENFCLLSIHKSRCNKFLSVDGVKENLFKNICTLKILFTKQTVTELWKSNGSISHINGGKYISSICDRIRDIGFSPSLHEIRPPPRKT